MSPFFKVYLVQQKLYVQPVSHLCITWSTGVRNELTHVLLSQNYETGIH